MKLYEFITPSDTITFYAPDNDIAEAVAAYVGGGKAGLKACDGSEAPNTALFFGKAEGQLERIKNTFANRLKEIIESAHTFAVCPQGYRDEYDILTKNGTDIEAVKKWDDKHRTSMSDWCNYARGLQKKDQAKRRK
jgi:hypothetical protein